MHGNLPGEFAIGDTALDQRGNRDGKIGVETLQEAEGNVLIGKQALRRWLGFRGGSQTAAGRLGGPGNRQEGAQSVHVDPGGMQRTLYRWRRTQGNGDFTVQLGLRQGQLQVLQREAGQQQAGLVGQIRQPGFRSDPLQRRQSGLAETGQGSQVGNVGMQAQIRAGQANGIADAAGQGQLRLRGRERQIQVHRQGGAEQGIIRPDPA